jgi:hypothetical protein
LPIQTSKSECCPPLVARRLATADLGFLIAERGLPTAALSTRTRTRAMTTSSSHSRLARASCRQTETAALLIREARPPSRPPAPKARPGRPSSEARRSRTRKGRRRSAARRSGKANRHRQCFDQAVRYSTDVCIPLVPALILLMPSTASPARHVLDEPESFAKTLHKTNAKRPLSRLYSDGSSEDGSEPAKSAASKKGQASHHCPAQPTSELR